ncbi:MAG TPA: zinc ribbon domain-containing protein [Candidatus Acidoferrales bacterium]|nr:zinc ribbon domain-containing protein [Candidatus Acidoferrales bacterium]
MQCPKCKTANSGGAQFCSRCHMTLLYKCPSCAATQRHGGTCDKCGVDFAKYAAMLITQEEARASTQREKLRSNASIWKQIILLPVTGGYSLMKFLLRRES